LLSSMIDNNRPDMHGFVWRTDERMIWSMTHRVSIAS
jgi:hypothetical protein